VLSIASTDERSLSGKRTLIVYGRLLTTSGFAAWAPSRIVLDTVHDGRVVESIPTGAGVDNIDYTEDTRLLDAAAAEVVN
jgi:hypothetical protein